MPAIFQILVITGIYLLLIFLLAVLAKYILSFRNRDISFWKVVGFLIIAAVAGNVLSYVLFETIIKPIPGVYWGEYPTSYVWGWRIITFLPVIFIIAALVIIIWKQRGLPVEDRGKFQYDFKNSP